MEIPFPKANSTINKTFNNLMASSENIEENASKVSTLVTSKDKLYRSVLAMAKDNGISVNHALNKSQGAGTLSRIVKELVEVGNINFLTGKNAVGKSTIVDAIQLVVLGDTRGTSFNKIVIIIIVSVKGTCIYITYIC